MILRIGTFNILNSSFRFLERKDLLIRTISNLNCDILGLQEVDPDVISELYNPSMYSYHSVPLPKSPHKQTPGSQKDGNGFLIKKHIEILDQMNYLTCKDQQCVAQVLKLKYRGKEFYAVNTHLDHLSDAKREMQLRELLEFFTPFYKSDIMCMGDYNFIPASFPYNLMNQEFTSVYFACNHFEPELTFPTGLTEDNSYEYEPGCFDYLWFKGKLTPLSAEVYEDCGNLNLWASDHFPLYADILMG